MCLPPSFSPPHPYPPTPFPFPCPSPPSPPTAQAGVAQRASAYRMLPSVQISAIALFGLADQYSEQPSWETIAGFCTLLSLAMPSVTLLCVREAGVAGGQQI